MDIMDVIGMNEEQGLWDDAVQDCLMSFFPADQGCFLAPPPMQPIEPDTSTGSVGSNGHCASRPDTSPPSSNSGPDRIQPSAPGSPGFCPSLLPRAVDPCSGPGHELGVPAPEPEDLPPLLPWDSLPLPPMPPPPMPPPPKSESPPHLGAALPQCCGPSPCIGLCTGVPSPALKQGTIQPWNQQRATTESSPSTEGGHLSEPLARFWDKQAPNGQRGIANKAEDLFAPAKDGFTGQDEDELGMGSLSDTAPLHPMRQCKISCSDLPSLVSQPPAPAKQAQDSAASQPPRGGFHPGQQQHQQQHQHQQQQQQQQFAQHKHQYAQQQGMQQDSSLFNFNANARRSSSFQQQQPQQPPVYTLYPSAFQRSISYGEAPMMPQPAQLPKSMGQPKTGSFGGVTQQNLQASSPLEVVQRSPTEQAHQPQQQQLQPQPQPSRNGRQTRATTGGARKKKGSSLQQVQPTSLSIKSKAGTRGKQGKAPSAKPYRDKNRDNKFLIISMEQELQEKLALATKLDSENVRLRQRERILSLSVASCEQDLQIWQSGEHLSSYITTLMQSFRHEVNVVTARRVIAGMAKIAGDRELNIDLFRDLWQALTSEISDALMKEGSVTGNLAATMAANARLSPITANVVDYFMAVLVRQQTVVQQAIGTNMFTGQEVSVEAPFWMSIAKQLEISPEQMKDFVALQGICGACHHKNLIEREILKERLERAMIGNQSQANKLMQDRKYVDTFQTTTCLARNLRQLNTMQVLASFMTLKLLTPLQICKLNVLSMPVFPNLKALLMVIGSQCPAEAAEQAECPLKSDPLPLEEAVDKWGLGF